MAFPIIPVVSLVLQGISVLKSLMSKTDEHDQESLTEPPTPSKESQE